jgi:hypothetical protein
LALVWWLVRASAQDTAAPTRAQASQEAAAPAAVPAAVSGAPLVTLREALDRIPCGVLAAEATPGGGLAVTGTLGEAGGGEAQVRAALEAVAIPYTLKLETVSQAMCAPLGALAEPRRRNRGAAHPLSVLPAAAGALYRGGQDLILDLQGPGFPAWLQVDYFTLEGYVVHLLPNSQDRRPHLAAGATRRLGDAATGGRFWTVRQPFGREVITVIASVTPLFPGRRPEAEPAVRYLGDLRRVLDAASHQGTPPVAAALVITTVPN